MIHVVAAAPAPQVLATRRRPTVWFAEFCQARFAREDADERADRRRAAPVAAATEGITQWPR
jgi:hypothetical protein